MCFVKFDYFNFPMLDELVGGRQCGTVVWINY